MALREQGTDREIESWYPPQPQSVRAARRALSSVLQERGLDVHDATLLVSELASNAVEHARTPFVVTVRIGSALRVEVADESDLLPVITNPRAHSERGRGLAVVRAMSSRWGVEFCRTGKAVWFELPLTPAG
jgi:anti-sigma regulatory factor (Ser/Thr protein kinase)